MTDTLTRQQLLNDLPVFSRERLLAAFDFARASAEAELETWENPPAGALAQLVAGAAVGDRPAWDNSVWLGVGPCGTTACLAGWAALQAGGEPEDPGQLSDDVRLEGGTWAVEYVGRVWLGLTCDEASDLFYAGTLGELEENVDAILADRGEAPKVWDHATEQHR